MHLRIHRLQEVLEVPSTIQYLNMKVSSAHWMHMSQDPLCNLLRIFQDWRRRHDASNLAEPLIQLIV